MKTTMLAAAAALLLAGPALANPGAQVCHDVSLPATRTNWNSLVTIPKFDPSLGELIRVRWRIIGQVSGNASFESLDSSSTTITTSLSASISLTRPNGSLLSVALPVVNNTDAASAFDGVIDFGGTSGKAYTGLSGSALATSSSTAAADLALFSAAAAGETISLPVIASGTSSGSGAGNLLLLFETFASASVRVCYEYTIVPAPSAMAMLALGGMVASRRRR
ncbi:MAG: choice-of-anchor E domain-containing protein [Phycisphaerae bacterium]|jgi:hypothetical protein